jgi:hypothetical protein
MVLGGSFWTWGALLRLQMQNDLSERLLISLCSGFSSALARAETWGDRTLLGFSSNRYFFAERCGSGK